MSFRNPFWLIHFADLSLTTTEPNWNAAETKSHFLSALQKIRFTFKGSTSQLMIWSIERTWKLAIKRCFAIRNFAIFLIDWEEFFAVELGKTFWEEKKFENCRRQPNKWAQWHWALRSKFGDCILYQGWCFGHWNIEAVDCWQIQNFASRCEKLRMCSLCTFNWKFWISRVSNLAQKQKSVGSNLNKSDQVRWVR